MLYDTDAKTCLGSHDSEDRKPQRSASGTIPVVDKFHVTVIGQRTVPGEVLMDPADNKFKVFFIFSNISVRVTGRYRWKCTVVNMDFTSIPSSSQSITMHSYECISDIFAVFSRRLFPKHIKTDLTPLEKSLMLQGKFS